MLIRFLPPLRLLLTIYVQNMRITEFSIQTFELHEKHEELHEKLHFEKHELALLTV